MRYLLILAALSAAYGQGQGGVYPPSSASGISACSATPPTVGSQKTCWDTAGALWTCVGTCTTAGQWVPASGSGSFSALFGDAVSTASGGATTVNGLHQVTDTGAIEAAIVEYNLEGHPIQDLIDTMRSNYWGNADDNAADGNMRRQQQQQHHNRQRLIHLHLICNMGNAQDIAVEMKVLTLDILIQARVMKLNGIYNDRQGARAQCVWPVEREDAVFIAIRAHLDRSRLHRGFVASPHCPAERKRIRPLSRGSGARRHRQPPLPQPQPNKHPRLIITICSRAPSPHQIPALFDDSKDASASLATTDEHECLLDIFNADLYSGIEAEL